MHKKNIIYWKVKINMIRKANVNDASRLAEILIFTKRVTYRHIFNNDKVSFNEMQVLDLALTFRDNEHVLDDIYVYDDGIVKGMIKWGKDESYPDCCRIHELYVDTFFQGQGIGSILINDCISKSKKLNYKKIVLWVLEENKNGRKFYEKHGFIYNGINQHEEDSTVRELEYVLEI